MQGEHPFARATEGPSGRQSPSGQTAQVLAVPDGGLRHLDQFEAEASPKDCATAQAGFEAEPSSKNSATAEATSALSKAQVREAAFSGARWLGLTQGVTQVTSLAAAVVLARLISPADFGRLAIAVIVWELSYMTAHETFGTPLVQRQDVEHEHLEAATFLGLLFGLAMALVTLLAVPLVTTPVFGARTSELFRLFAPQFAVAGVMVVPFARLQRDLRFRRIGLSEAVAALLSSGMSVGLAVLGLGAEAYALGMLTGSLVMTIGFVTGGGLVFPRWRPRHMRELLGFGLPTSAAGFAGIAYRNIDYLILGVRLPAVFVGFYYRAFTVGVEYERRLSGIVARIAFPVYSRIDDPSHRLAVRLRIVRVNVMLVYPLLALFVAVAPTFVPWIFGARWIPAVLPAQILAVAGMASCVRNLTNPTVLAAGRPRALLIFSVAETLLYGATVWVAASYGLVVVCIAVSCFQIASLLIAYTVLLRSTVGLPRTQIFYELGPAVLASVPLLGVAGAIRATFATELPVPVLLLAAGAGGGAAYALTLHAVSREAWSDLAVLAGRLFPKFTLGARRARAHQTAGVASLPTPSTALADGED